MSNRKIHLCTRVVLRYIGTLRFTTYTLFSQSNLRLKLEQIYCMASFWCCHQNNTVTRVSKCKLKLLLFVIMNLNIFLMFCKKVVQEFISWVLKNYKLHPCMRSVTMTVFFFYIDHDTSFHKKRKTYLFILFFAKESLNNHFQFKTVL